MAMPGLTGDYFADSLIYICDHTDDGAMGIMVNRTSDMSLVELFSQLGLPNNRRWLDTPVLEGGPVSMERGLVLHSDEKQFESSAPLGFGLCLSTALDVLQAIASDNAPQQFLVALGYAGWGAGQLEDEVANNVWLTAPAETKILFHQNNEKKLTLAAQTLGIDIRLIAARPGHA